MTARRRFVLLAVVALVASPAFAQSGKDPREKLARQKCLTGDADTGARLLAELFTELHDATYIYNQGRCYQQNERPAEAIRTFQEYLRVAKALGLEETEEVNRQIADCRAMEERAKQATANAPATATVAPVPPPTVPPPQAPAGVDLATKPATGESQSPPFYKTWWFWTGAGAVVVAGTFTAILIARRGSGTCDGESIACMGVK